MNLIKSLRKITYRKKLAQTLIDNLKWENGYGKCVWIYNQCAGILELSNKVLNKNYHKFKEPWIFKNV